MYSLPVVSMGVIARVIGSADGLLEDISEIVLPATLTRSTTQSAVLAGASHTVFDNLREPP